MVSRKKVDVTNHVSKCHACHVKRRWMSPSALPGTQSGSRCHQVPRLPRKVEVHGRQVPRLPCKVTVHVAKCHACHANSGGVHGVNWEPSAPPEPAQCHKCHACQMHVHVPSPAPATQNARTCRQVPRLPRHRWRPRRQLGTKRATRASPVP